MKKLFLLSAVTLALTSCSHIIMIEESLARIEADNDSLRAELARLEFDYFDQQQRDFLAFRASQSAMLLQIDEKVDVLAGNVSESNQRISEINNRTGVLTEQFREQARQDSLEIAQANAERRDLLNLGINDFNLGNFTQSLSSLESFIETYPEAPVEEMAEAVYWSGEAQLALMKYDAALEIFTQYIKTYPEGEKRCAAIYKMGLTFEKKDDTARRNAVWKRLIEQCPDSREALLAKNKMQ